MFKSVLQPLDWRSSSDPPHPAKIRMITVQPTKKGTMGLLVLALTAPSRTTRVTRQVMATSPNSAPPTASLDCSMLKAAPWALAKLSLEVMACWWWVRPEISSRTQGRKMSQVSWTHLCHCGTKHPSKQLAGQIREHHVHLQPTAQIDGQREGRVEVGTTREAKITLSALI